ncbi:MAG: hypothetical protein QS98_C0014G0018 [archaeon GW2011_AR3]|nr:MAG: hypothetical protein QS98_C0014G0018 [archaeon GW2011_AR3]MBS3109261.1 TIGR00270 family protein [Candidatus Woesearchaeota archaeon]
MQCEMCGINIASQKVLIEGTEMTVCADCGKFGEMIEALASAKKDEKATIQKRSVLSTFNTRPRAMPEPEIQEIIVGDYAEILHRKRERMGMTQKEFAAFLAERESIIHKIETNSYEMPIKMARKFEKLLKVSLIEEYEEKKISMGNASSGDQVTIGDLITVRKRA